MPFFEGKQALYHILCFLVIPIAVCTKVASFHPKRMWLAPIFTTCIFLVVSAVFYPYIFSDIFSGEYDFTTIYWLIYVVPVQVISAVLFTFLGYLLTREKTRSISDS